MSITNLFSSATCKLDEHRFCITFNQLSKQYSDIIAFHMDVFRNVIPQPRELLVALGIPSLTQSRY